MFDICKMSFSLNDSFLKPFKGKDPDFGPLGKITYMRTYSRRVEGEDRTEQFWETLARVVNGTFSIQKNHCKAYKLPWDEKKAQRTAQKMFKLMWDFKFLPPGRGLWAMGTDQLLKNGGTSLNNCAFISTQDLDKDPTMPFCFLMDMSMLGVGVGFDTRGADKIIIQNPQEATQSYQIPDTREGWVEAVKLFLLAYFAPQYNYNISFDFSLIRPAGSIIRGFGGIASGPEPLIEFFEYIKKNIFEPKIGQPLSSTDIVDIMNLIGKVVVSGNSRRSSEVALGELDDKAFINLKQDEDKLYSHRWASNNSIFAKVGMDYKEVAKLAASNGEPGFIWLENIQKYGRLIDPPNWKDQKAIGCNPCLEQSLEDGEVCNLVETFPSRHDSLEEYLETLKVAYLYAKTVTLVPTHWEITNSVMLRNRRIGLSQSGIIKAFNKHGRREMLRWCDEGYKFIDALDTQYSNWLGIPRSIKKTSVKPSGTVSLLPGEPPGIHYPHSEFYIRRIRVSVHSPLVTIFKEAGYKIEPEIGKEFSTVVIEFPIKEDYFTRGKEHVSIWEQVYNAVAYQKSWADNQISVTITVREDEKDQIANVLELSEDSLKAISFLPLEGHGYKQAPYETICQAEYEKMIKDLKPIKWHDTLEPVEAPKFCDSESCQI